MRQFAVALSIVSFSALVAAGSLPDTTVVSCYDGTGVNTSGVEKDGGAFPRQDCRYGYDAAARTGAFSKTGGGEGGLDYTALDAAGNPTTPSTVAPYHSCVRDNITGLTWEVKSNNVVKGLRDTAWTYSWYNSDPATNGFDAGTPNGGTCYGTGRCDTEKYVADVNAAGLCGFSDWRMPTLRELLTITNQGSLANGTPVNSAAIDMRYFPTTQRNPYGYWSITPYAQDPSLAWSISFGTLGTGIVGKYQAHRVQLVRGSPF